MPPKAKKSGMYSGLSARSLSGGEAEGAHQVGNFQATLSVAQVFLLGNSALPFSTWRNGDTYYGEYIHVLSPFHNSRSKREGNGEIMSGRRRNETGCITTGSKG